MKQLNKQKFPVEIILQLKIKCSMKYTEIVKEDDGVIFMYVAAKPINNQANKEIIKFMAKKYETANENVEIFRGESNSFEIIKILYKN